MASLKLTEIGRIPSAGDNLAIAIRRLEKGSLVTHDGAEFQLGNTVLEGHRFAIQPISQGQTLLSWGLPFGLALLDIGPGDYACNASILATLRDRSIDFELPTQPNFKDHIEPYRLDESRFRPGKQVPPDPRERVFRGYQRGGDRGVGTRNYIVLLGTTSRTGSYVKQLESRLRESSEQYSNIDGIVAIAHTEGGTDQRPNNLDLLLRTLAGFMVNPNVGAVLAVDYGSESVTNEMLRKYLTKNQYPLNEVPHEFFTLKEGFQANLDRGEAIVRSWLDRVNQTGRSEVPASCLKIGLQCGGSDAFSGISSNPLLSWVAMEIIRQGGIANLAETDELIGAEPYVLKNVRDLETAQRFLAAIERFKDRTSWHGTSAEGNPSGGNKFRGLYNIVLKSIGAANKLHPDVRLDYVLEYGERMLEPGFCFMDSPGNDLESVAGQIAAGANLIFFTTGNGSITNFPYVPTIKIMNTTRRYELLSHEMDVNAGAYLDGTPMEDLGRSLFDLSLQVASGKHTKGELAGHAQTSIWRNWQQTDDSQLSTLLNAPQPRGRGLSVLPSRPPGQAGFLALNSNHHSVSDQIGLILPTSLCSGQIARMAADRLNQLGVGKPLISRFVSLVHTEGCGVSGGSTEALYSRTMMGYLSHPLVRFALLLEHGCEKTHNDFMRQQAERLGLDFARIGFASVQLDGGIEKVLSKIEQWFRDVFTQEGASEIEAVGLEHLRLGLLATGPVPAEASRSFATISKWIAGAGGTVVIPHNSALLSSQAYLEATLAVQSLEPSLAYGQKAAEAGFHIMETPSDHWVETLTGLGATGVEVLLAYVGTQPRQGHPLVPMLQVSASPLLQSYASDLDLFLSGDSSVWAEQMLRCVLDVASRRYSPKVMTSGNSDFQMTRGLLGVSL